jgi:RNA polymerase sigma-70 factor (ECF subfamily)
VPAEIERLYREHRAGLVRLVERELHDHQDAEDVVQTAFLDAQRALERGTIPQNPPAWLAAIALNAARRLRRRRLDAEPLEDYAVQEASRMSEVRAVLTSLPRQQRAAVLYRDVLGLSYGETAELMGTSVNAVTMLLHRGRKRLREGLGVTTVGVGLWRMLRQAGTPQSAILKGAAVAVSAAGLATGGIVAAERATRAVAPIRAETTFASVAHSRNLTVAAGQTPAHALTHRSTPRRSKAIIGSQPSSAPASTQAGGQIAPAAVRPTAAAVASPRSTSPAVAVAPPTSTSRSPVRLPTVPLPTLSIPTLPLPVPATVTVATPLTAATVTIPTGTTVTVTTPLATVTLPLP